MKIQKKQLKDVINEVEKLHHRFELSKTVSTDYYEPGMMEYLDQSDGIYDSSDGRLILKFESRGTRYDGRSELIEKVAVNDVVIIRRDKQNRYNSNNFELTTECGESLGNMPAELCNAIAPLYDAKLLTVESAKVSFVEPISIRNRHAKQAILFVEMCCKLNTI